MSKITNMYLVKSKTVDRFGEDLVVVFYKLLHAREKLQSLFSLYSRIPSDTSNIADNRDRLHILFYIVSEIYELYFSFSEDLNKLVYKDLKKFEFIINNINYIEARKLIKEIHERPLYKKIRNQLGFHHGDSIIYKKYIAQSNFKLEFAKYESNSNNDFQFSSLTVLLNGLGITLNEINDIVANSMKISDQISDHIQKFIVEIFSFGKLENESFIIFE
jgi:hypothetical protein